MTCPLACSGRQQALEAAHEQLSRMLPLQPWSAFWVRARVQQAEPGAAPAERPPLLPDCVAQHAAQRVLGLLASGMLACSWAAHSYVPGSGRSASSITACCGGAHLRALLYLSGAPCTSVPEQHVQIPAFQPCLTRSRKLLQHATNEVLPHPAWQAAGDQLHNKACSGTCRPFWTGAPRS